MELHQHNEDWFQLVGPDLARPISEGLICMLWVRDQDGGSGCVKRHIDVFVNCLQGTCACVFNIEGVRAQLRLCRVYAECYGRGDVDPDWEYILRGACFGYRVIDDECDSAYNENNYGSITKGEVGMAMSGRLQLEIDEEIISVVDEPCVCVHALGSVPKGHDDFRAIIDCSSPDGRCVNDSMQGCRVNFSYNLVESVTEILQEWDVMATVDVKNAYREVNMHPSSRVRQGLAWDFGME